MLHVCSPAIEFAMLSYVIKEINPANLFFFTMFNFSCFNEDFLFQHAYSPLLNVTYTEI
jgi:hypothetical protein